MDVKELTGKQRDALRHLNERAAGPELVASRTAAALIDAGFAQGDGKGERGKTRLRLTEAGVRAATALAGGGAA